MCNDFMKERIDVEIENLVKTAENFKNDGSVYVELFKQRILNTSCNN